MHSVKGILVSGAGHGNMELQDGEDGGLLYQEMKQGKHKHHRIDGDEVDFLCVAASTDTR